MFKGRFSRIVIGIEDLNLLLFQQRVRNFREEECITLHIEQKFISLPRCDVFVLLMNEDHGTVYALKMLAPAILMKQKHQRAWM